MTLGFSTQQVRSIVYLVLSIYAELCCCTRVQFVLRLRCSESWPVKVSLKSHYSLARCSFQDCPLLRECSVTWARPLALPRHMHFNTDNIFSDREVTANIPNNDQSFRRVRARECSISDYNHVGRFQRDKIFEMHWNRGECRVMKPLRDFCEGSLSSVNHNLRSVPFAAICIHITRHLYFLTGNYRQVYISLVKRPAKNGHTSQ
jgi:hypothetical protein